MSIEFACSNCGEIIRTPPGTTGKNARCPACQAVVEIPQSASGSTDSGETPSVGQQPAQPSENPFSDGSITEPASSGAVFSENPYASPTGVTPRDFLASSGGEMEHTRIRFSEILQRVWPIFQSNLGICALVGLVLMGLTILAYVVMIVVFIVMGGLAFALAEGGTAVGLIVLPVMLIGGLAVLLGYSYLQGGAH